MKITFDPPPEQWKVRPTFIWLTAFVLLSVAFTLRLAQVTDGLATDRARCAWALEGHHNLEDNQAIRLGEVPEGWPARTSAEARLLILSYEESCL